MKKIKPLLGFLVCIVYGLLAITVVVPMIVTACICKFAFGRRVERARKYQTTDDFPNLKSYPVKFISGKNKLDAYFVVDKDVTQYKAVMIMVHGIGCSRASYVNRYDYFAKKGYIVFAYDSTGTCESEGKGLRGLPQTQVDFERAIEYVSGIEELKGYKLFAYGHSWGGYGTASELNSPVAQKLDAVATLGGFNDIWSCAKYQLGKYVTGAIVLAKPWLYLYYIMIYGKRAVYTGIKGVNAYNKPVLVMHSKDDLTVKFRDSVAVHQDENTNPQAEFVIYEDRGHTLSRPPEIERYIQKLHYGKKIPLKLGKGNVFEYNLNCWYELCDTETVYIIDNGFMDSVNAFFEKQLDNTEQVA